MFCKDTKDIAKYYRFLLFFNVCKKIIYGKESCIEIFFISLQEIYRLLNNLDYDYISLRQD